MTLRRSVFAAVAGRYVGLVLQILAAMVLARLLTPAEMGVWAAAQAAILLSASLRDFGATDYLVRSGDISPAAIGRMLGLMLSISLACAAVLWFSRDLVADFFGEPRLAGLIALMTVTYLITPLDLARIVVLEREFAFVTLQFMHVAAILAGSITAIALAAQGFGFYSLAWGQLVQLAAALVMRAFARPQAVFCRPLFAGWGPMLHFGTFTTLLGILGQVSLQSVTAILGRVLGFASLGLYDRANGIGGHFYDLTFSVMQVVYVGLSRVRDKPADFAELFIVTLANFTGILWPAHAFVALLSLPIILFLFGDQWAPAAPLLTIVSLAGMLAASYAVHLRMLTTLAHVQTIFLIELAGTAVRLPAVYFLAQYGLVWATIGVAAPGLVTMLLYWQAIRPHVVISRNKVLSVLWRSLLVTLSTVAVPMGLMQLEFFIRLPPFTQLALCAITAAPSWLLGVHLFHPPLRTELAIGKGHAWQLLKRPRHAGGGA